MSHAEDALQVLRQAFDRVFAEPPTEEEQGLEELIVVRLGGERLAIRLTALAGIERLDRVVPLPGGPPGFLGLAGLRGRLVPVFDLAGMLGRPAGPFTGWVAVVGRQEPVGWAFDELVGVETVAREAIKPAEAQAAGALVPEAARLGTELVGVLSVEAVMAAVALQEEEI
ncbi:MAG: chemotaxis protein CheW [Candidatus Sericytochromatia bacterium]